MTNRSRDAESAAFLRAREGLRQAALSADTPTLSGGGTRAVEAWFLGPKGENADELERLVVESIRDQAFWRRNFHPGDPTHITEAIKRSPEYVEAMGALRDGHRSLLGFLKKSVPFFSMRYQGHMNWDLTIPGVLGYFTAMLYNPNNVAFEGSTATTLLEMIVGDDLCRMLGYAIPGATEIAGGAVRPWGHITCDGTVANIEAIWAARNLKFYPLSLKAALRAEAALAPARGLAIALPLGGSGPIADLDTWSLLNLKADDVLAIPARLEREHHIGRDVVTEALSKHSLQNLGLAEFTRRLMPDVEPPVFLVPGTKHYSFPKAAALLGLGAANMIDVPVDRDARMDLKAFGAILEDCVVRKRPIIAAVAVIGSTEESAIDPVAGLLALRDTFRQRAGLDFHLHADAAWGGYHASCIRDDFDMPSPGFVATPPPAVRLSKYSAEQFDALGRTDSITVDPHKSGYIPYPAGALCYRNSAMRDLVTFSAPVVFHGDAEPTVGIYGVEGSKPGAAAAAVYLSHRVIRPSKSGYGKIIGEALFSCRKLYARLLCMARDDDRFIVVPVARLPAERRGADARAELETLRTRIDRRDTAELLADEEAFALFREIGPDQNILAYAFNFKVPSGKPNTDLGAANLLNKAIYQRLSIDPGQDIYGYDLIVSTTDLSSSHYGMDFIDAYKERLGVAGSPGGMITVLRSVVMDPWVTETAEGSFIDVLEKEIRKAVSAAIDEVAAPMRRGY